MRELDVASPATVTRLVAAYPLRTVCWTNADPSGPGAITDVRMLDDHPRSAADHGRRHGTHRSGTAWRGRDDHVRRAEQT